MATKALAVGCLLLGLVGQLALVLRVLSLGLDQPLPTFLFTGMNPWLVDVAWLFAFGVQHSGMARAGFKHVWMGIGSQHLERSCYVAASGLLLLGLSCTWQTISGGELWRLPDWVACIGLIGIVTSALLCLHFDALEFLGLRQAWQGTGKDHDDLRITGFYRLVRHPMMSCLLVFLWMQPNMTPTLALLGGGMSVYIWIGITLEERDMRRRFGSAYEAYRQRVPAVLPWRLPAPSSRHSARELVAGKT